MAPVTPRDVLAGCQLFARVKPEPMKLLESIARLVRFDKGEIVFLDGQPCPGVYIVGTGLVRVFKTSPSGKEHVLHMVSPGNTFAEVAAMGGFPCPANAQAIQPTTCVLLPTDLFQEAMQQSHALCLDMMAGMTYWVRHLVNLIEDIVLRDALGRVARYLLDAPMADDGTVELPTLKRHVASHLNLTSETFSRTLSRLLEAGVVAELGENRLQLRNRVELRRMAG